MSTSPEFQPAPIKPVTSLDVMKQLDVRVGTIRQVDDMEKSKSLVKLTVSFGDHERTILAGIKTERDDVHALQGVQALFVVNLPPREMMGIMSEGMLFDLGYEDGILPALSVPERPVPDGTRAG
jgi:tRNA-binding protein